MEEKQKYAIPGVSGMDITKGKKYPIFEETEITFKIMDDDGDDLVCRKDNCWHLSGETWEIIEE